MLGHCGLGRQSCAAFRSTGIGIRNSKVSCRMNVLAAEHQGRMPLVPSYLSRAVSYLAAQIVLPPSSCRPRPSTYPRGTGLVKPALGTSTPHEFLHRHSLNKLNAFADSFDALRPAWLPGSACAVQMTQRGTAAYLEISSPISYLSLNFGRCTSFDVKYDQEVLYTRICPFHLLSKTINLT